MTHDQVKQELEEITTIYTTAASSYSVLTYLHMTIGGIEGNIISTNSFLRTSIFAYYRLTILELSKLFPDTGNDNNNHFSLRLFIANLKNKTTELTALEATGLEGEDVRLRNEKTGTGELIIKSIKSQRDSKIAHTDKGRFALPDGLSLEDLHTLLRGGEIMLSCLHKRINGADFSKIRIDEPAKHLQSLVEELAETKRKQIYQQVKEAREKGVKPEDMGAYFELLKKTIQ